jgi:hypothetical protein
MASFQEYRRRGMIPLAGIMVAAYYLIVLLPLSRRTHSLDAPLQSSWNELSSALEQTNVIAIDFQHITNQLAETKRAIALLDSAKQKAAVRLELSSTVRARMTAAFQLVDYQDERSRQAEEIIRLAKAAQVAIEPTVLDGFPEHTADTKQPAVLWAALSLVESLLNTALQCKVTAIHSLEVPLTLTNEAPANASGQLTEIPLQIELTGSSTSLLKLVQTLPLRAEEMRTAGLTNARPDKAPLFIDRLVLKKQSPEKPDEVRLSLRAVGFVLRE